MPSRGLEINEMSKTLTSADPGSISHLIYEKIQVWEDAQLQYEEKIIDNFISQTEKGSMFSRKETISREEARRRLYEKFYDLSSGVANSRIRDLKRILLHCEFAMMHSSRLYGAGVVYLTYNDLVVLNDSPENHHSLAAFGATPVVNDIY